MRRKFQQCALTLVLSIAALLALPSTSEGVSVDWIRQFGIEAADKATRIAMDSSGNIYLGGYTDGGLFGVNAGKSDVYLAKYDTNGDFVWGRQFGTDDTDSISGVVADEAGSIYVAGNTWGDLEGPNLGFSDAYLRKYDADGNVAWTRRFGTSNFDESHRLTLDHLGNAVIVGGTRGSLDGTVPNSMDAFVAKYDPEGSALGVRQYGFSYSNTASDITFDELGNMYLAGSASSNVGPTPFVSDGFLAKLDGDGNETWVRWQGSDASDSSHSVALDGLGHIYLVGSTQGSVAGPYLDKGDFYLFKYDLTGETLWSQQLATPMGETSYSVEADPFGNVYVAGFTNGEIGGPHQGMYDIFVMKFDANGVEQWAHQLGTTASDEVYDMVSDHQGNLFLAGASTGSLGGPRAGFPFDAVVLKINDFGPPDGDFNHDGVVDAADYTVWRNSLGATALTPYELGDGDGDGDADEHDYLIWKHQYGRLLDVGSRVAGAQIPEPRAVSLLMGIVAILAVRGRRLVGIPRGKRM